MDSFRSLTALKYDDATFLMDTRQSMGPGEYSYTDLNCSACLVNDARLTMGSGSMDSMNIPCPVVDIESDLHNRTRPIEKKYNPNEQKDCVPKMAMPQLECNRLATVDTRLTTPSSTLRGTGWNRFHMTCRDSQKHISIPCDTNINTGILMKDNHRPYITQPIDQTHTLPPGRMASGQYVFPGVCDNDSHKEDLFIGEQPWRSCSSIN